MGRFHRKHLDNDKNVGRFRRKHLDNRFILKIILISLFLFLSYQYYKNNVIIFFEAIIQLPFIYKIVEGYVYWIVVAVIGFCIWKVVDYFS